MNSGANYSHKNNFTWILFLLLLFCYIIFGIVHLNNASDPQAYDTTAYLGEANIIKYNGGILNFLNLCFSGKYIQANQHPLYILLLSPFATTDISFFISAKLLSFLIGLILIICLFIIARRMFGDVVALITAIGLILNDVFLKWTTMVASESLLMLFSLLGIYFIIEGFRKNSYWIYAGISLGLAYLAKGTGMFLVPGFVLSAAIVYKLKIIKNKYFYLFFLALSITASPLLIRNIVVYHDPFFNVNKYIAKYSFEQIYNSKYTVFDPQVCTTQWKFEKNNLQEGDEVSANIPPKKLAEIDPVKRIMSNLKSHLVAFFYTQIIYQKYISGYIIELMQNTSLGLKFWFITLVLFSLFVVGLLAERSLGAKLYLLTTIIIFYSMISLFRPLVRYSLPLLPIIWIYIALGFKTIGSSIYSKYLKKTHNISFISLFSYILTLFLVLNLGYFFFKNKIQNPFKSVEYSESRKDLLEWLRKNLKKDDMYTMGPNFNWQLNQGIWILPPMNGREDITLLIPFVKRHNVRYIIFERSYMITGLGKINKKLSGDYFDIDEIEGLLTKKNIENWHLVYKDPHKPVEYLVYKSE